MADLKIHPFDTGDVLLDQSSSLQKDSLANASADQFLDAELDAEPTKVLPSPPLRPTILLLTKPLCQKGNRPSRSKRNLAPVNDLLFHFPYGSELIFRSALLNDLSFNRRRSTFAA